MKKKQKRKKTKSFWHRIRFKYKLSFFNENTLDEVWSFRLSQLSAFVTLLLFALFLIIVTSVIIIMTPIRNYLPGYLDVEVRKNIMQNALKADSLERMVAIQSLYLNNVAQILTGNISIDSIREIDSLARTDASYDIPRGEQEEAFIKEFEEEEAENATEIYRGIYNTVGKYKNKLYDGIEELLTALKDSDAKIAVATSKYEPFAEDVIKIIGAYDYFDKICGSNLDGSRKDKKDIVEYARKELGLSENDKMVLVGDTFYDTKGALAAGIDFIGVNYGYGNKALMVESGGKNFADTPMDILKFLTE